jgi:hypothetical protein
VLEEVAAELMSMLQEIQVALEVLEVVEQALMV